MELSFLSSFKGTYSLAKTPCACVPLRFTVHIDKSCKNLSSLAKQNLARFCLASRVQRESYSISLHRQKTWQKIMHNFILATWVDIYINYIMESAVGCSMTCTLLGWYREPSYVLALFTNLMEWTLICLDMKSMSNLTGPLQIQKQ